MPLSEGILLTALADGVVLKDYSDAGTELKVLDPKTGTRRVVIAIQGEAELILSGTRYGPSDVADPCSGRAQTDRERS